jgi:Bacterial EndoU nuclease
MHAARLVIYLSRIILSPAFHHGSPEEQPLPLTPSNRLRERRTLAFTQTARLRRLCLLAMAVLCCVSRFAGASGVAVDCTKLAHWTTRPKPPQVNQVHVFCGEWKRNAPNGFHSRPGGLDPGSVTRFTITQPANAQGIYGGSWSYTGHARPPKSSTMFPDACSMPQVLNSIVYAATQPTRCPANAPGWAVCGPNRPTSAAQPAAPFCEASDGTIFLIAMGKLSDGRVNTAFPLR